LETFRDKAVLDVWARSMAAQQKDPYTKRTRRYVFWSLIWTYCFIFIWFALHPEVPIITIGAHTTGWITSIFGGASDKLITITGGHIVIAGLELIFMVVGFFAMPSRRR
jgi:uncharacterized membrane protein